MGRRQRRMVNDDLEMGNEREIFPSDDLTEEQEMNEEEDETSELIPSGGPQATSMDLDIYEAATTGNNIDAFKQATEDTERSRLYQVTPQGNTVLHLASRSGHDRLVEHILNCCPGLFSKTNSAGNLALYVAAGAGHISTVKTLVHFAQKNSDDADALKEENREKNTALHVALKNQHKEVAMFMVESDASACCIVNYERKSPLYIAAEAGWLELVKAMVEKNPAAIRADDFFTKSPVHAAITGKNIDILDTILSKDSTLINSSDKKRRTPLSYAASIGYFEGVNYLLEKFPEGVYLGDKNGFFPIHGASAAGHINIIQKFLRHCPDTMELLNKQGQNILHVAAMCGKSKVVSYMLKTREFEKLINERDEEGNTPLHLAAKHCHPKVVSALTWDNRVNLELVNKKGSTALDAALSYDGTITSFRQRLTWRALRSAGAPRAQRLNSSSVRRGSSTQSKSSSMEISKERVNTLLLVSTLVATVAFAAGFTVPGGNNDSDPEGMATLVRRIPFHVFLICNTIAMYSSIVVDVALIWAQLGDLGMVLTALKFALPLLGVALTTMCIAYMAGVSLVVSNLNWLASFVLIVGSVFLAFSLVLFVPLYSPNSSNRITRYIFYYPFCLVMWVTGSDKDDQKD
ncbi:hypothetical protein L1049_024102 [Liquidambar formosana]|uniref:PGG domain-containing protein n=1 Tax=Liquidambar formosana TaxID=63359 RepID=A0AAP0X117_LIQFO